MRIQTLTIAILNEYSGGEIEIYVGKAKLMKFSLDNIKITEY